MYVWLLTLCGGLMYFGFVFFCFLCGIGSNVGFVVGFILFLCGFGLCMVICLIFTFVVCVI